MLSSDKHYLQTIYYKWNKTHNTNGEPMVCVQVSQALFVFIRSVSTSKFSLDAKLFCLAWSLADIFTQLGTVELLDCHPYKSGRIQTQMWINICGEKVALGLVLQQNCIFSKCSSFLQRYFTENAIR